MLGLIIVALVGSSCTDDAKREREYERGASKIIREFGEAQAQNVGKPARDPDADIAVVDDLIKEYRSLDPPSQWKDEHKVVVAALGKARSGMIALRVAVERKDPAAVQKAHARITVAAELADAAVAKMRRES